MAKAVNLLGQKFGRLTVLSRAENDKHGAAQWLCVCICGNKKVVRNDKLRHGETLSCGCYRKEKGRQSLTTHGLSKKPHGKRLEKILANNIEQQRNKRNNRLITFKGETLCLAEWSERTGLTEAYIQ